MNAEGRRDDTVINFSEDTQGAKGEWNEEIKKLINENLAVLLGDDKKAIKAAKRIIAERIWDLFERRGYEYAEYIKDRDGKWIYQVMNDKSTIDARVFSYVSKYISKTKKKKKLEIPDWWAPFPILEYGGTEKKLPVRVILSTGESMTTDIDDPEVLDEDCLFRPIPILDVVDEVDDEDAESSLTLLLKDANNPVRLTGVSEYRFVSRFRQSIQESLSFNPDKERNLRNMPAATRIMRFRTNEGGSVSSTLSRLRADFGSISSKSTVSALSGLMLSLDSSVKTQLEADRGLQDGQESILPMSVHSDNLVSLGTHFGSEIMSLNSGALAHMDEDAWEILVENSGLEKSGISLLFDDIQPTRLQQQTW